jgi:hypothetical protein
MFRRLRASLTVIAVLALALSTAAAAAGHPGDQHGSPDGHLLGTGEWGKIDFVSSLRVSDAEEDLIADVAVDPGGDYAYLARWGGAECAGPEGNGPDGGVYVIDISDLENPREVGFIRTHQDTLVGEGMQVIPLSTSKFTGNVLAVNHELCGKNGKAGFSLWDVTNPLKPKKLSENFGDFTADGVKNTPRDANQFHSVFIWDAGDRAYLVASDDDEAADVDIFDITNPKKPVQVADLDLNQLGVSQPELGLTDSFLHDMVVKHIGGRWIMLLSYWDGGYVLLDVTNPANPVYLRDTDYPPIDPQLFELRGTILVPEGNGHQAEFTIDNRFIIATDEDFDPYRLTVTIADEGGPRIFNAKAGTNTTIAQAEAIGGTPIFVGTACPGDPAVPPAPDLAGDEIAVVERGVCFFTEKVASVLVAGGYEAVVIMNREGADACVGTLTPDVEGAIPTILIGRDAGFALFDVPFNGAACLDETQALSGIPIGTVGDPITDVGSVFDGWGYVHLYDATTLAEVDTFVIPEAMNPAYATGFGDLSVHEVAVDPQDPSLAYLSYYSGGLRALQIQCANPADTSTCELVEVGGYLDPAGNNFWGVETFIGEDGFTYILASDMDSGLWIFRDP